MIKSRCGKPLPGGKPCRQFKPCRIHPGGWGKSNLPSNWKSLKKLARGYDTKVCYLCGTVDVTGAVDHIQNRAEGGSDDPSNLAWICHGCHTSKTVEEAKRATKRKWGRD